MTVTGRLDLDGNHFYTDPSDATKVYPSVTTVISRATDKSMILTPWGAKSAAIFAVEQHDFIGQTIETIGAPGAIDMIKSQARRWRELKADIGTYQHDVLEALIIDAPIPDVPDHLVGVEIDDERVDLDAMSDGLLNFLTDFQVIPEMAEATVANPDAGVAGTLDLVAVLPTVQLPGKRGRGCRALIDLKTGQRIYEETEAQIATYRNCTEVWIDHLGNKAPMPKVEASFVLHLREEYERGYKLIQIDDSPKPYEWFLSCLETYKHQEANKKPLRRVFYPPLEDGTQPLPLLEDIVHEGGFGAAKLKAAGITTLEELSSMTQIECLQIDGIGPKKVEAIIAVLGLHGLNFASKSVA